MKYEDNALAVIAGYVDTLGFVALFGLFTTHVTGNFVLIGAGVAGLGQGVLMKLMAFPAFIAGVVLSSVLMKTVRPKKAARLLYCSQAVLLLGFCLTGVAVSPATTADTVPVVLCGMLGAVAMGVQNAHSRLVSRSGVPNTVMTGNVTQAVLDAVDLVSPDVTLEAKAIARERFGKTLQAVVCFGCGAIAGAAAYRHASFWALLLPLVMLVCLATSARGAEAADTARVLPPGSVK